MKQTLTRKKFNPYYRIEEARAIIKSNRQASDDIWVNKLVAILQLRDVFKQEYKEDHQTYFEEKFPLYADLLNAFEDTRVGGDRELLEACILASGDCGEVAEYLDNPRFTAHYLALYRQMFYVVDHTISNKASVFQNIVAPILKSNGSKLAVGVIWKLLALVGGLSLLFNKGLGTAAIRIEDMEYLMQLTCMRHLSTMLQYASNGVEFFEENPAAAMTLSALSEFDGLRGSGRRTDYIANITDVSKNRFSNVLSGELKLISAPNDILIKMSEVDGTFEPALEGAMEVTKHLTFIEENNND